MNVTIVSPWSIQHNYILRRVAEQLPWPVSERPKPNTLNYFIPYQCYERTGGPNAVLFSHDMGHVRWPIAARDTDMRLAWTTLYTRPLSEYGPTRRVIPGIDHDSLTPGRPVSAPVIGVAGLVYGDGRKGEDLWRQLVTEKRDTWDLRAAGAGWAGLNEMTAYENMPDYYRGLRVFLCCSRVEGVPYPPIEALACGVRVVIPRGVGLLDELPDIPGIHRFTAGDYAGMVLAIEAALTADARQEQLRDAVAGYTWQAWVDGHVTAFEELL